MSHDHKNCHMTTKIIQATPTKLFTLGKGLADSSFLPMSLLWAYKDHEDTYIHTNRVHCKDIEMPQNIDTYKVRVFVSRSTTHTSGGGM